MIRPIAASCAGVIGTISIRLGSDYGELEACAALHETASK